jgi:hypothetical protein
MAGGRRPANFATSGARHVPSDGTANAFDGYSIWQQPHMTTSPLSAHRPSAQPHVPPYFPLSTGNVVLPSPPAAAEAAAEPVAPTVATALATALDAAVISAVTRALSSGAVAGAAKHESSDVRPSHHCTASQDDHAVSSSSSFNNVVGGGSGASSVCAGADFAGIVELQVESEAQERRRDVEGLYAALAGLEARMDGSDGAAAVRERERTAALEARVKAAEALAAESAADVLALQGAVRGAQKLIADLRMQKRKADSDADRMRARVSALESQADAAGKALEALPNRIARLEREVSARGENGPQAAAAAAAASRAEKAVKAAEDEGRRTRDALDALSGLRSRVKRLETSVEAGGKRAEEMSTELALQSGAVDQLRGCDRDVMASVQGLKRLVEANLRSHSSSEGVVQSQAQLITRHVCVALRQFIARRITENNVLIDKTLRARVPAYAEGNDGFVLVRETDIADLPTSEAFSALSPASASALTDDDRREASVVLPRNVVDAVTNAVPAAK